MPKKFGIVEFVDEAEEVYVEIVRIAWMSDKWTKCKWPSNLVAFEAVKDLVKTEGKADTAWGSVRCKLVGSSGKSSGNFLLVYAVFLKCVIYYR